jgi:hypothetical protein
MAHPWFKSIDWGQLREGRTTMPLLLRDRLFTCAGGGIVCVRAFVCVGLCVKACVCVCVCVSVFVCVGLCKPAGRALMLGWCLQSSRQRDGAPPRAPTCGGVCRPPVSPRRLDCQCRAAAVAHL